MGREGDGVKLGQVTKVGVSKRQLNDIACIDIFNKNGKGCYHRCPDPFYSNMLLLIIYLSAVETLSHREMSSIGSTFFGFAQNTIHDFQNSVLNS